jgi:hypothetical protein
MTITRWYLAKELLIPRLHNAVIRKIEESSYKGISEQQMQNNYNGPDEGCPLRCYLIYKCAWTLDLKILG